VVQASRLHSRWDGLSKRRYAFTLIEILVVVAIIALLIAILFPALQQARMQAKITVGKANSKQIATAGSTYGAEEKGYVPIMHNWHATAGYSCPARASYLSLALRRYEKGLSRISEIPAKCGGTNAIFADSHVEWVKGIAPS